MEKIRSEFRYDINGLRAIAVIFVIIFHFKPDWIPAGFVGVDIFFAISGYLMTSIICNGIAGDRFSILGFYAARFKRIVPALILMVAIVIAFGYLLIEPYDYQKIGLHGRDSLLFISNITYLNESGYFDVESLEKFLLHTWSLSVEWQFYLIYPLILLMFSRFLGKRGIKYAIVTLFFISLIISIVLTRLAPSNSYYMIHSRGWEMMAGGLAFLFPLNLTVKTKKGVYYALLSLCIASSWMFTNKTPWPGSAAAIPVIATALILSLRESKEIILGNKLVQTIGKLSYSIYLYHWPILVYSRKLNTELSFLIFITLTVLFSLISYHLIEKRRLSVIKIIPFFVVMLITCQLVSLNGVSSRVDLKTQERSKNYNTYYNPWMQYRNVQNNPITINSDLGKEDFILTGDSYALMYVKAMEQLGLSVSVYANESCNTSMLLSAYSGSNSCQRMKSLLSKKLKENSNTPLVISQSWDIYLGELGYSDAKKEIASFMDQISSINPNRKIYIIGMYHQPSFNPYTCLLNNAGLKSNLLSSLFRNGKCPESEDSSKDMTKSKVDIDKLLELTSRSYKNIEFISIKKDQCKDGECLIIDDSEPLIVRPHLTKYGSEKYTKYLMQIITEK